MAHRLVVGDDRYEPGPVSGIWLPGGDYTAMLRLRARRGSDLMEGWMSTPESGVKEAEGWGAFRGAGSHARSDEEMFGAAVGVLYPRPRNSPALIEQFPRTAKRMLYLAGSCTGTVGFLTERGSCFVTAKDVRLSVVVPFDRYLPLQAMGWEGHNQPYIHKVRWYNISGEQSELIRRLSEALKALRFGIVLSALNLKAPAELRLAIAAARVGDLTGWVEDDLFDLGLARWGKWPNDGQPLAEKEAMIRLVMLSEGYTKNEIDPS